MPTLNVRNAESAFLAANARVEIWRKKFLTTWAAPAVATTMALTAQKLAQLPPEVIGQLQQADPQAWAQVEQLAKRKE